MAAISELRGLYGWVSEKTRRARALEQKRLRQSIAIEVDNLLEGKPTRSFQTNARLTSDDFRFGLDAIWPDYQDLVMPVEITLGKKRHRRRRSYTVEINSERIGVTFELDGREPRLSKRNDSSTLRPALAFFANNSLRVGAWLNFGLDLLTFIEKNKPPSGENNF